MEQFQDVDVGETIDTVNSQRERISKAIETVQKNPVANSFLRRKYLNDTEAFMNSSGFASLRKEVGLE